MQYDDVMHLDVPLTDLPLNTVVMHKRGHHWALESSDARPVFAGTVSFEASRNHNLGANHACVHGWGVHVKSRALLKLMLHSGAIPVVINSTACTVAVHNAMSQVPNIIDSLWYWVCCW